MTSLNPSNSLVRSEGWLCSTLTIIKIRTTHFLSRGNKEAQTASSGDNALHWRWKIAYDAILGFDWIWGYWLLLRDIFGESLELPPQREYDPAISFIDFRAGSV
ncbi:hypothetical protein ACJX0J_017403 [Zea mays]